MFYGQEVFSFVFICSEVFIVREPRPQCVFVPWDITPLLSGRGALETEAWICIGRLAATFHLPLTRT